MELKSCRVFCLWNPCCSTKQVCAEISFQLSIHGPLAFWTFYLATHHLLSCTELSAVTGEGHKMVALKSTTPS